MSTWQHVVQYHVWTDEEAVAPHWIQPVYWKKLLNSTVSFKSTETKQLARQRIEQILAPKPTRRPLPCLLFPSFFYAIQLQYTKLNLRINCIYNLFKIIILLNYLIIITFAKSITVGNTVLPHIFEDKMF